MRTVFMRRLAAGLLCCGLGLLVPLPVAAIDKGSIAPDFQLDGPGGPVSLAAGKGKVVLVDFWASWCVPCKKSFPWLNEMHARYGEHGLRIVGINLDTRREDAQKFLAAIPANFTIAFDASGTTPRAYGIVGFPSSALIGGDGRLILLHAGFREADKPELERQLRQALGVTQ